MDLECVTLVVLYIYIDLLVFRVIIDSESFRGVMPSQIQRGTSDMVKNALRVASSTADTMFLWFGYLSIIILYNPSGYSYWHWASNYQWLENLPQSFLMGTLGAVITGFSLFILKNAWRMTLVLGKIIFFALTIGVCGYIITSTWFDQTNFNHWSSLVLFVLVSFGLYGAVYPRLRWKFFRTRQVEDADTTDPDAEDH